MQPAATKIALCPNQSQIGIENPGKFHDDAESAMLFLETACAIDTYRVIKYSSVASFKLK